MPQQRRDAVAAENSTPYAAMRVALAAATGGRRWSQLDADERRAMIAVYSTAPSAHGARTGTVSQDG